MEKSDDSIALQEGMKYKVMQISADLDQARYERIVNLLLDINVHLIAILKKLDDEK